MKSKKRRSVCPINYVVEIFGDKWTLLVVRDILMFGRRSFKEFSGAGEGIATNILTDRLNLLESEGIIVKETDPEHGSRKLYKMTKKGKDLLPLLVEMMIWSGQYDKNTPISKKDLSGLKKEKVNYLPKLKKG